MSSGLKRSTIRTLLLAGAAVVTSLAMIGHARGQTGACCVGTSCTLRTLSACNTAGGDWQGAGTNCSGNTCGGATVGACCNNTTFGCTVTQPSGCTNAGTFLGLGVSCLPSPGPCGPLAGACCTITTGACQATLAGGCTGSTSVFFGTGSSCSPSPCPGACCDNLTQQCTITASSACSNAAYLGNGVACSPSNPCLGLGACCDVGRVDGGCRLTLPADCPPGSSATVFQGVGTTCTPSRCVGACCKYTDATCFLSGSLSCQVLNGSPQGLMTTCLPDPCLSLAGACCDVGRSDGGCRLTLPAGCPPGSSATVFQGVGTVCLPNPCVGACCLDETAMCTITASLSCMVIHGRYLGNTTACTPDPCLAIAGACCDIGRVDGGCRLTLPEGCLPGSSATVFQGIGTLCSPDPCVGACCNNSTAACSVTASLSCQVIGGTFVGSMTACSPCNPCVLQFFGACCRGTVCTVGCADACSGVFLNAVLTCGTSGNPVTCCPANFNGTGGVTVQDIFDFLAAFFGNNPAADFNHSSTLSVQDIFDFLAAFFTGCPG